MKVSFIKVFGERHTASNAVTKFICENFDAQNCGRDVLGWRHRRAPKKEELSKYHTPGILFVITVRNPYTWLPAMARLPYNIHQPELTGMPVDQFATFPIEDYENAIQMWNAKYRLLIRLRNEIEYSDVIKMEDFSVDQERIYNRLCRYLEPAREFQPLLKEVTGHGETGSIAGDKSSVAVPYSQETLDHFRNSLDPDVMRYFDYSII